MPSDIATEADLENLRTVKADVDAPPPKRKESSANKNSVPPPEVLNVAELLALDVEEPKMLIETLLPTPGACLLFGTAKSGKTLLAIQAALAVASGRALFDNYAVVQAGPTLVVEQDDPAGASSVKTILQRATMPVKDVPFHLAGRVPWVFGPELIAWLEEQIKSLDLRLVVLDSYTALRGSRGSGVDIVKAEQNELTQLDDLAKRTGTTLLVIHHASKGSAGLDWSDQAAGTFAMAAATEAQIHISRFRDLDGTAPERLVRVRGRHIEGVELVLRFRKDSLDYEHVLEGGASPLYPLVLQIRSVFGQDTFAPKEFSNRTGFSLATAHRHINQLFRNGVLTKRGYGEYALAR
jgi:hypothetical protein